MAPTWHRSWKKRRPEGAPQCDRPVKVAPAAIRGVVQVWHAQLLAHLGDIDAAEETARRGLLDPHLGHPFAAGHGRFTLVHALGRAGGGPKHSMPSMTWTV